MFYYAGIGSRTLPYSVVRNMTQMGIKFAEKGWTLRSGGALGADRAFEDGCKLVR